MPKVFWVEKHDKNNYQSVRFSFRVLFGQKKIILADTGPTQVQKHDEKIVVKRFLCPTLGKILRTCWHWCVIGAQGRKSLKMTRR